MLYVEKFLELATQQEPRDALRWLWVLKNGRRVGLLVDVLTIIVSFYVSYALISWIRGELPFSYEGRTYYETFAFLILSGLLSLLIFVEYPTRRLTTWWSEVKIATRINIISVFIFTLLSFILKVQMFSRFFFLGYFIVNLVLMLTNRALIRGALGLRRRAGWDTKTRLILGCTDMATKYVERVELNPQLGIRVLGYLADEKSNMGMPYLGLLSNLRNTLLNHQVDGIVITLPMTDPRIENIIDECELQGIPVELTLDNLSSKLAYSHVVEGMGLPRLILSQVPHSPNAVFLKRTTDIILSGIALIILSPLFLFIAMVIKLGDRGPVFFTQTRVGQFGRTFHIHKFRSMRVDAERVRDELMHLNEMSGPVFKITHDPRVTRVGHWLRKLSLDELPQFYDVFVGNMSLVGPRPPLPSEVQKYDVQYRRRLSVKPGITCLWQISGRNDIDFDAWMKLDLAYIDTWSYGQDIKILLKTIPVVLKGKGAS